MKYKEVVSHGLFAVLLLIIWAVAARDTYWSVHLGNSLYENEINPVGRWLIAMDNGEVSLFMSLKIFGTCVVTYILCYSFLLNIRYTMVVTSALAIIQIVVLTYLEMG